VTWLFHVCDVTHSRVWHDSFMCVTWLIHRCDVTHSCVWRDWFMCVTSLIHVCDVTHSCVWRDSFMCVTWLIHVCDMWRDSFIWPRFISPILGPTNHVLQRTMNYAHHHCFRTMAKNSVRDHVMTHMIMMSLRWYIENPIFFFQFWHKIGHQHCILHFSQKSH